MTTNCKNAIRSLFECARLNAVQARQAEAAGHHRMAAYRRDISQQCARDARALRATALSETPKFADAASDLPEASPLKSKGYSLRTAAPLLGVHFGHLHQVVQGRRQSRRLMQAIEALPNR